jgi:hypothetical protein
MNKISLTLISTLVVLTGCAAIEPVSFSGPSGKSAYSMRCSGMGRTVDMCYQKAGELCPKGYVIIDKSNEIVGMTNSYGNVMMIPKNSLAIECK